MASVKAFSIPFGAAKAQLFAGAIERGLMVDMCLAILRCPPHWGFG